MAETATRCRWGVMIDSSNCFQPPMLDIGIRFIAYFPLLEPGLASSLSRLSNQCASIAAR